jgi:hypothetical protein
MRTASSAWSVLMPRPISPQTLFRQDSVRKRRRPESNRCARLCRPLRSHSATAPRAPHILGPALGAGTRGAGPNDRDRPRPATVDPGAAASRSSGTWSRCSPSWGCSPWSSWIPGAPIRCAGLDQRRRGAGRRMRAGGAITFFKSPAPLLPLRPPRAISSAGRAPARQAGGHWFEPSIAHLPKALLW